MNSRLCYETIPRSKSMLPGASDVVVELIGTQNRKIVLVMLNEKLLKLEWLNPVATDETAGSLGGTISSVVSFHLSSRL